MVGRKESRVDKKADLWMYCVYVVSMDCSSFSFFRDSFVSNPNDYTYSMRDEYSLC